ncbi:MAG: tetratricopeptide repeat protein [Flavobacteriales bacterium]|jgi:predicted Zn-dependent protease
MKHFLTVVFLIFSFGAGAQDTARIALKPALSAYSRGALDSAFALVNAVILDHPGLEPAYKLRGDIHQRKLRYEEAMEDYDNAENLSRTDPRLYVSRSALRIAEGNNKGALRDAEKAIELDATDADAWYNRAWALYLNDEGDAALKSVKTASELRPGFPEALYLSGVIKGEQYNEKEGIAEIAEALRLKPNIPGGLMSKAVLQYEGKQYEEAIATFSEVIATDTTELANAYYYRADSHYEMGDKEKACADFNRSMRFGDKDASFIKKNYCDTDAKRIPKKPKRTRRKTTIQF